METFWRENVMVYDDFQVIALGNIIALGLANLFGATFFTILDETGWMDNYRITYGGVRKRPPPELIWKCAKNSLFNYFFVVVPLVSLGALTMQKRGISGMGPLPSPLTVILSIAFFHVCEDFFGYWIHRWMHTPWAFKHIHRMHHTIATPFPLANLYMHPGEVLNMGMAVIIGPFIIGPHLVTHLCWIFYRTFDSYYQHCGFELWFDPRRFIGLGAEHHDIHHRYLNVNFCFSFPWWDTVFGTRKTLADAQPATKNSDKKTIERLRNEKEQ